MQPFSPLASTPAKLPHASELLRRKPQRVTATLSWGLMERLQQRADYEGRSVSNLVCHLLEISLP